MLNRDRDMAAEIAAIELQLIDGTLIDDVGFALNGAAQALSGCSTPRHGSQHRRRSVASAPGRRPWGQFDKNHATFGGQGAARSLMLGSILTDRDSKNRFQKVGS